VSDLVLKSVHKHYGQFHAVKGIDLTVKTGDFAVLVGPSGCGKSTLLRSIAGLEEISHGDILHGDNSLKNLPPRDRNLAMVFQSYALYPYLSVFENIAFGLRARKVRDTEVRERVRDAAELLGLTDYLERKPRELSGGQRQRVAIGRAIVRDAELFLFDEPLSNLDAKLRDEMREELKKLHKRLGKTFIYVTHDQIEAMTLADQIVLLNDGMIEQEGAPLELFEEPRNLFVAGFLGSPSMNMIEVSPLAKDNLVQLPDGQTLSIDAPMHARILEVKDPMLWGVRPEHFAHDEGAPNAIMVDIAVLQPTGSRSYASFRIADTHVVAELPAHTVSAEGERISLSPNMAKTHFFNAKTGHRIG